MKKFFSALTVYIVFPLTVGAACILYLKKIAKDSGKFGK